MSRSHTLLGAIAGSAITAFLVVACGSSDASESADSGVSAVSSAPREVDAGRPDAGPPPPSGPPKRIFTKRFVVNVRARPDRESPRIGYLRAGSVLQATTHEPVSTEGCREGWFELTTGGFVCNGRDVIAFEGRRLPERRAAQPDREAPMPYRYARTRRDNTPMYRRLPTDLEAAVHEGYRPPGMRLAHLPDGAESFTTIELKSNFLGTAREGTLQAFAKPAHLGHTTQVWDASVSRQADGATIALFRCTQMVLWPKR